MSDILVSVCVITYNHCNYIRQCLNGILMQNVDFPLEIIVNDDCSIDGTGEIIREYEKKYPDLFRVTYQSENQYSKGVRGMFARYCFPQARGKYIALCEGDDYWIDSLKLRKQVDFLEINSDYTMTCSNALIQTKDGELDWSCYNENQDVPIEDIIINGGLFIQTASYLFRRELLTTYPLCCQMCHVGDYPLIIYAALNGKVRWFVEKQVVYRFSMGSSWTATNNKEVIEHRIKNWRSEIDMLIGLDIYSNFKYHAIFDKRQVIYIYGILRDNQCDIDNIIENYKDILRKFSFGQRLGVLLMRCKLYNPIINVMHRIH